MSTSVYSVVAYIARYWFAALAVVIAWRAILWLRKDAYRAARVKRHLPDAGYIGEWAVIACEGGEMAEGAILRAPRDGWVGSARACDVRVKCEGVPARAARFTLGKDGLHVLPVRGGSISVDGELVQREAVLRHGATLTLGGATLQLRLFAGVLLQGEAPVRKKTRRKKEMPQDMPAPLPEPGEHTELPKPALTIKTQKSRRQSIGTRTPEA